jgi:uncharacterized protein
MSNDPPGISRREAISFIAGAAISGGATAAGATAAGATAAGATAAGATAGDATAAGATAAEATAAENAAAASPRSGGTARNFRIRTLTAGTPITSFADTQAVEAALEFLAGAKRQFEEAGYVVQTIRVALNPLLVGATSAARADALPSLVALDNLASARGAVISIGPAFSTGDVDQSIGTWAQQLARTTKAMSFSGSVASADLGVHREAVMMAAEVIAALGNAGGGGIANFRFAAAACVPAGTPFFPVAYHGGTASLAVGLETPNLVRQAFAAASGSGSAAAKDPVQASERLRVLLDEELRPVAKLAHSVADQGKRRYLGIDTSPAPGRDSSIGLALETLTGQPFGSASTLQACAAVTAAIKSLAVTTCGYSGLMLPILEDPVLAQRAIEGRIKISDLLLYSTVCGTGLDVVPVPGDSPVQDLARVIGDMATLAVRLKKPLSARLFTVPGKKAGDQVEFADPLLCSSKVMSL